MENIPHSLAVEILFLILIKFDEALRNSFVFIDVGVVRTVKSVDPRAVNGVVVRIQMIVEG